MTVRMGYVPRRSDASGAPKGTGTPGAILRAGTSSGKAAKTTAVFKPCENSEETAFIVVLSISLSDALDSAHNTPLRVPFH